MDNNSDIKQCLQTLYKYGLLNENEFRAKINLAEKLNLATDTGFTSFEGVDLSKQPLPTPVVTIKNFTKHYKGRAQAAVQDISFNIYPGHFHAFIGANGAGKTTTIKSIIGAYSKFTMKGDITINGLKNDTPKAKQLIGYIPENAVFPKKMKSREYLTLMAMLAGFKHRDAKQLADQLLVKLDMTTFANKCPASFSSGQKKKMLLAQALIRNPSILIMDEPAANLDPLARDDLFETLLKLQKEGKAIFLSSHILDEVSKFATFVTILDGGKVVFDGPVDRKTNLSQLYRSFVKTGSVDNHN